MSDEAGVLQANKDHFDHAAKTGSYDDHPFVAKVCSEIAEAIRKETQFDKQTTTLLDYACGTGQMSRYLTPYTRQIVGIDLSQGMVDFYNQWALNQGISSNQMRAILLGEEEHALGDQKFDVIVCVQAYHHFADIQSVTNKLASLLKPSGKLFVADLMKHDVNVLRSLGPSTHGHMRPHHPHHGGHHGHGPGHGHGHQHGHTHGSEPSHTHSHKHESYGHGTTDDTSNAANAGNTNLSETNPYTSANKDGEYTDTNKNKNADRREHDLFQGPSVVRKGGFEEDDIRVVFEAAGLVDWKFIQSAARIGDDEKHVELFLAVGRVP